MAEGTMPKTASVAWKNHLKRDPLTLATCYRIERRDGTVITFTTCVFDLVIDDADLNTVGNFDYATNERTYSATALAPSESREVIGTTPNNLNLQLPVDDGLIQGDELGAGLYDYAQVLVFTVNYEDLTMGPFDIWLGYLGAISQQKQVASVEVNSLSTRAQQTIGRVTRENCRHRFGSPACGVNLAGNNPDGVPYTASGVTVTATGSNAHLIFRCSALSGKPVDFYRRGVVRWLTGDNAGLEQDIAAFDNSNGEFMLWDEMPYPISNGDTADIMAGCAKTHRACWEDHNSGERFGGYPKAPTLENAGLVNNR